VSRGRWSEGITDAQYLEKLKSLLVVQENGCWEKQGFRHVDGYGCMYYRGKQFRAHKLMYTLVHGPVPKGMVVMHTCDNPPCCNPDHLKLGTYRDNNRDMFKKKRHVYSEAKYTHCKQGHEFSPENTWICRKGFRHCRICQRVSQRLAAGWTREQAEALPPTPKGKRPVGGTYQVGRRQKFQDWEFSTRGSAPRQRAWRARQKAKRLQQNV
jgi:hypothetical protein